jgi:hypothetical protein
MMVKSFLCFQHTEGRAQKTACRQPGGLGLGLGVRIRVMVMDSFLRVRDRVRVLRVMVHVRG